MELSIQTDTKNIDWTRVPEILKEVGMSYHTAEGHERAFTKSHSVIFIFDKGTLIGFGRAISDGEYQSANLRCGRFARATRGKGIGRLIVQNLVKQTPHCNFILYASPGKEAFYEKENFRKMKTGMALFANADRARERGFTE